MKIKTDKKILWLIAISLILPLQSVAMFKNSSKPVVINATEATVETINGPEISIKTDNLSEHIRENNAKQKKEYLMTHIEKCDWTTFEWIEIKEYLLAYMFNTDSSALPSQDDIPMEFQRYKVKFIEITEGFDGAKIINDIVAKIMNTSHLTESQAFFLIFDAILNHLPSTQKHVHPNGCVVKQLSAANLQYPGQPYTAKKYAKHYRNVTFDTIYTASQHLGLTTDGKILSTTLVNTPNILAQLLQNDTAIEQPRATKTAQLCTAGVFIGSYPPEYWNTVFVWLAGKRLDYELKSEGGFYQGEIQFRQFLREKMLGLHATPELQPTLAVLALDGFGFNYMKDRTVKTANSCGFEARVQSTSLKLRPSVKMITDREISSLSRNGDILTNIKGIALEAGLAEYHISVIEKNNVGDCNNACRQILFKIRMIKGYDTAAVLEQALQRLQLNSTLAQFADLLYVSAD